MKNKIYITGLFSIILPILGGVFKINHWPGASVLLLIGIFCLVVLFIPAATISCYKGNGRKNLYLYITIILAVAADFTGALFKLMHWPGASIMVIAGILSPILLFLPAYLFYHFKNKEESHTKFFYIMFLFVYLSVMSALLSLNVSKEFIYDSMVSESIVNLDDYYQIKLDQYYSQYQSDTILINKEDINVVRKHTLKLINYIDNIYYELTKMACQDDKYIISDSKNINLFSLPNKDNHDIPAALMIGKGEAGKLKDLIDEYKQFLLQTAENNNLKVPVSTVYLLDTKSITEENKTVSWEEYQFEHIPLILVIQSLTDIRNRVIMSENEIIANIRLKKSV